MSAYDIQLEQVQTQLLDLLTTITQEINRRRAETDRLILRRTDVPTEKI